MHGAKRTGCEFPRVSGPGHQTGLHSEVGSLGKGLGFVLRRVVTLLESQREAVDMARTPSAQKQRDYRQREGAKMAAIRDLAEAFTRAHLEIREDVQDGLKGYRVELSAPAEVHQALENYCQRHKIDVETYLTDVGGELLLKVAREAKQEG